LFNKNGIDVNAIADKIMIKQVLSKLVLALNCDLTS